MRTRTQKLTICAAFTALSVMFVYLSAVIPRGQFGFIAVASLFGIASIIEAGIGYGSVVYAASSVLSLLLVPDKAAAMIYILFFGYYPIVKSMSEKVKIRAVEWVIKLAIMNCALAVILFAVSAIVIDISLFRDNYVILFAAVNVVFVIFDIGVTRAIGFYTEKISRRIKRG